MKTRTESTVSIKTAKYNPKNRTAQTTQLLKSVKSFGILVPLIIDGNKNLIDGHRRLFVAKKLKLKNVPIIEIPSALSKEKAYEIINTTSKKISNHDLLFIYINGGSVPDRVVPYIKDLEKVVGSAGLVRLAERSATYTVIKYAKVIQKYCRTYDEQFLRKIVFWLIDNKMIYYARRAMEAKVSSSVIQSAIKKNKPLTISYA